MSGNYHSKYAKAVNRMLDCNQLRILLQLKTVDWESMQHGNRSWILYQRIPVTLQYGDEKSVKVNFPNPLYLREALKRIRGKK